MSYPPEWTSGRVLLIDDDHCVRRMLGRTLRRAGHIVSDFGSALDALEVLAGSDAEFDVLITDAVMPDMTGREAAERIEALRPGIGIIFMSGYPAETVGFEAAASAGRWFLSKPFESAALLAATENALAFREARA